VRNTHKDKPTEWIRKQTLVNAERYGRVEKEYEAKILGAEEKFIR
jgi:DNA mismatch repair protein MutS